ISERGSRRSFASIRFLQEHDMRSPFRRARAWGVALLVAGVGIFVGVELFEEPEATWLDLTLELVQLTAMILVSAGVFLFWGASGRE
ncbi:MAG: hypothetical protein ACRD1Z_12195, partial [Vicinamibacteria bacterium]